MITKIFQPDSKQAVKLNQCYAVVYIIVLLQASYGVLIGIVKGLGL